MLFRIFVCCTALAAAAPTFAHDTWVETNTNLVRTGDAIYVDLMLGNHGNEHRDYKIASKIDPSGCTLSIVAPEGTRYDLIDRLVDTGYAPREGFWRGKFVPGTAGLYRVEHTLDNIVNHGHPVRAIKTSKTYFVVSHSLDSVPPMLPGGEDPIGTGLEIVPVKTTVMPMGPGLPIAIQVLFEGEPLADARVSFIPRSETLSEEFDERYERTTDAEGKASFTPKTGDQFLVAVHRKTQPEDGAEYDEISYSATLAVYVPEICPCCD